MCPSAGAAHVGSEPPCRWPYPRGGEPVFYDRYKDVRNDLEKLIANLVDRYVAKGLGERQRD